MQLLRPRLRLLLIGLAVVLTGCAVWRQATQQEPLRFSHEKMLHQSVVCADCHTEDPTGARPALPTYETCSDCHDEMDAKKPPDRRVTTMFVDGKFKATGVTAITPEVIFSHKSHSVDHQVACNACHKGIEKSTAITKEVRVGMQDCITCHAQTGKFPQPAENCATCHKEIRKDVKPATHEQNWARFHGQKAKDGDQEGLNQCSLCHTEDSCNSCHRTQAPANHTILWRQRTHGVAVSTDRDTCATCHQSDFCISCHQTTAPRTHRGQWGEPKDKHCVNCHLPESGESCSVCHQEGTPSHAKAVPTPATMVGTDCRSCHAAGSSAKMPHVDNGDDCNYCHH